MNNLQTSVSSQYAGEAFSTYTVNGHSAGLFKNSGNFSYIRVYGAGHEVDLCLIRVTMSEADIALFKVPAYNYTGLAVGQAAAQFFTQAMTGQPLSST